MNVTCVVASVPNALKAKPVVDALERAGQQVEIVFAGDDRLGRISEVCAEIGLRGPDVHLQVGPGSDTAQTAKVMIAFERHLQGCHPDWVIVIDDASAALACALVAAKAGCPVAHLEAGLRSHDWSRGDEVNRVAIDRLSDLLLVPSPNGVNNLRAEGFDEWQIQIVGSTLTDTLKANVDRACRRSTLQAYGVEPQAYGLLMLGTAPAGVGRGSLSDVFDAAAKIAQHLPILVLLEDGGDEQFTSQIASDQLLVVTGIGYLDTLALQAGARLVLTDQGTVQEETSALGVPCLTSTETTDRPVTITNGTNRLVGADTAALIEAADDVLSSAPSAGSAPLWDGQAAERTVQALARAASHGGHRRTPSIHLL